MSDIVVTLNDRTLSVDSPYNPEFVTAAKKLAGRWDGDKKTWEFSKKVEPEVRAALIETYGADGSSDPQLVDLLVDVPQDWTAICAPIRVGPIEIARAFGRDSGARLAANVVLVTGRVKSGGSRNNWRTWVDGETQFKILDVPRPLAERIVALDDYHFSASIIEPVEVAEVAEVAEVEPIAGPDDWRHAVSIVAEVEPVAKVEPSPSAIIQQTNELARAICVRLGYDFAPGHDFSQARDGVERDSWIAACEAQKLLNGIEVPQTEIEPESETIKEFRAEYRQMSVKQLRAVAKNIGFKGAYRFKKRDLIEALLRHGN
jgi:hypothetical protein